MDKQSSDGSDGERNGPGEKQHSFVQSQEQQPSATPQKPSLIKRIWTKTGLDVPSVIVMLKAGVAPAMGLALYEIDAVARHFTTIGYLLSITSILGVSILPRAKFIQTITLNILAVCLSSCMALLGIWCANQARLHTTVPGPSRAAYNSSASAVSAVWLFFQVYLSNSIRSARPQLQIPGIVYSIYINIAMVYSPGFPTIAAGKAFATKLLEAFLSGFAIAIVVHFLVFPVTMRKPVFGMMTGYLQSMRGVLKTQMKYVQGFETENYFAMAEARLDKRKGSGIGHNGAPTPGMGSAPIPQAMAVRAATGAMIGLNAKLKGEIPYAKREVAFGKLSGNDINELFKKTRDVTMPLLGLSSIIGVFERISKVEGWDKVSKSAEPDKGNEKILKSLSDWHNTMKTLHQPFAQISVSMDEGIEHVLYQLEFVKRPKKAFGSLDEESPNMHPRPGDKGFADYYAKKARAFFDERVVTLRQFCEQKGIDLPAEGLDTSAPFPGQLDPNEDSVLNSDRRQLFVVLHMEYLLGRASRTLMELIRFADSKVSDGTMKKTRFIVPSLKRIKKAATSAIAPEEITDEDQGPVDQPNTADLAFGEAFLTKHDAEHLPPANIFENFGNYIRIIPRTLRSRHSIFGFRAACAVLSIAIVAYLRPSHTFFTTNRVQWAMIMVAFSMQRTAGSSGLQFVLRIGAAVVAMVAALVIWYIVDGHPPGVIVFTYLLVGPCFLLVVKKPIAAIAGILTCVNTILVIGYELQVRKLGEKVSASNGQVVYPTYKLAPYRLAAVTAGITIAYFWTIFPFPITEHGELRRMLGGTLFLLANYYAVVHESIGARVRGDEGNMADKMSPGRRLEKARYDVFAKIQILLGQLKASSNLTNFQLNLGGRFPKETYDRIIVACERIVAHAALIGYASTSLAPHQDQPLDTSSNPDIAMPPASSAWLTDFHTLLRSTSTTSHEIISILSLLSSSISNNQPLPPYMRTPPPFGLLVKLHQLDADILSVRHMAEPGYAAFAVMQLASRGLLGDVEEAVRGVRALVGELDFSYHSVVEEGVGVGGLARQVTRVETEWSAVGGGAAAAAYGEKSKASQDRNGKGKND